MKTLDPREQWRKANNKNKSFLLPFKCVNECLKKTRQKLKEEKVYLHPSKKQWQYKAHVKGCKSNQKKREELAEHE